MPLYQHHQPWCLRGDLETKAPERCPGVPFPAGEQMYSVLEWQLSKGQQQTRLHRQLGWTGKANTSWGGSCCNGHEKKDPSIIDILVAWGNLVLSRPPKHSAFLQHFAPTFGLVQYPRSRSTWGFGAVHQSNIMRETEAHQGLKLCSWYLCASKAAQIMAYEPSMCFLCCSCTGFPGQTQNMWDLFCKPLSDAWLSALIQQKKLHNHLQH